jgi:hypothetical protein
MNYARVINEIEIKNFRGIREGKLSGLSQISILVGPNNSGKSTALEAVLLSIAVNFPWCLAALMRRGGKPIDALSRAISFNDGTQIDSLRVGEQEQRFQTIISRVTPRDIHILEEARKQGMQEQLYQFRFLQRRGDQVASQLTCMVSTDGGLSTPTLEGGQPMKSEINFVDLETVRHSGALEDAYSSLEKYGKLKDVVAALRSSFSTLQDLRILKVGTEFVLHSFFSEGEPVPTYLAGDGFKRMLALASALFSGAELVVIEEPEAFQHPRYLRELTALIHAAAKKGVQIVLSTHSIELLDLLLNSAPEGAEYPTVHRTRLVDGKFSATRVSHEDAARLRSDLEEDLRS